MRSFRESCGPFARGHLLDALQLQVNSPAFIASVSSLPRSRCQEQWWFYLANLHTARPRGLQCNLSGSRAMLVPFVQARPTCCLHRILDIRVRKATRRPGSNQFLELGALGPSGPSLTSAGRSLCDQAKSSSIRSTIRLTPSSRPISPVIQIWSQMGLKTSELTFSFSWKAGSSRA